MEEFTKEIFKWAPNLKNNLFDLKVINLWILVKDKYFLAAELSHIFFLVL